jgi:hypothetical protein
MKTTTTNHARKTEPSTNQPHANPTRISAASGTVDARLAPDWQTKQKQQQNWTTNREENVKDAIWNSQETENFGLIPQDLPLITVIYDLRFVRWKQYYRYKHHRRSFWGRIWASFGRDLFITPGGCAAPLVLAVAFNTAFP